MNKWVFFDCDGTILDTFKMIEMATKRTFDDLLPNYHYTIEEIHSFFGPLLDESFARYAKNEEELKKLVNYYRALSSDMQEKYVRSFKGIKELLTALKVKGYKLGIVSNKVTSAIQKGLEVNDLENDFDKILGVEQLPKPKPDATGLITFIQSENITEGYLVGDTAFDILCGENVKKVFPTFKTIGVTWCKTTREEFEKINADYIVDKPIEILECLK